MAAELIVDGVASDGLTINADFRGMSKHQEKNLKGSV